MPLTIECVSVKALEEVGILTIPGGKPKRHISGYEFGSLREVRRHRGTEATVASVSKLISG